MPYLDFLPQTHTVLTAEEAETYKVINIMALEALEYIARIKVTESDDGRLKDAVGAATDALDNIRRTHSSSAAGNDI